MGMIRVSEDAEKQIKALSEGKTITATVDALLARNDIAARMDKMASYLGKKLNDIKDEIISSIEDTAIDRLDGGRRKTKTVVLDWEWPTIQELLYDVATQEDYVTHSDYLEMHQTDCADQFKWYIEDNQVWGDFFGEKKPYLNISPTIANFLTSKGVVWQ